MRADRLLSLLMLLQIKGQCTAQELAKRLEVSERTIYRDIEALSLAGVPVYAERGPGGGCMLAEGYRTNLTGLTEEEVRTLFMPGASGPLTDLGVHKALEAAMLKLLAALPSDHRLDVERIRQRFYMDAKWWTAISEPVPFLQTLQDAVWQDRKVCMIYQKANDEVSERIVDPLALVVKAGTWYMVTLSKGELRVFRVSRIRHIEVLAERSLRPVDFDLEKFWLAWCTEFMSQWLPYSATLRIAPALIPILPQLMGEVINKVIEEAGPPDSEGWITLTLQFGSYEGARSHIMGFGTLVEIIEPRELRENIINIAVGIVQFYKEK